MQEIIICANQAGQRLDKFLHKYLPNAGTGFLYKMLRKKNITLNGKKAEGKEILQLNDKIQCFFADETFEKFSGHNTEYISNSLSETGMSTCGDKYIAAYLTKELQGIDILYEDSNILVLNKPAGILSQKAKESDVSLNEWMIGYLLAKKKIYPEELTLFKPSICNRLDRNTSGIVLCGISLKGSQLLNKLIKERSIKKYYRTICKGTVNNDIVLCGNIKKDNANNIVTISDKGKEIQTGIKSLKILKRQYSYLEIDLITGKTHQIRAHLASIGHPLIGDRKYGIVETNKFFQMKYSLNNQLLHAYRVEFPVLDDTFNTLSKKVIWAPLPEVFQKVLEDFS